MAPRFSHSAAILLLCFLLPFTATFGNSHEDPIIKTMEDFSGYPVHDSHSFISNSLSALSVDAQSLQNQVKPKTSSFVYIVNFFFSFLGSWVLFI